jgi:hypothetical protein
VQILRRRRTAVAGQVMQIAMIWAVALGISAGSAGAQATTTPTERFVLSGVVFAGEGRGLAWLQEPTFTNNYVIAVRPGDSIGPYRVTKILEDQVVLEGPGGTVSIPLAGGPGGTMTAAVGPETQQAGEPMARAEEGRPSDPAIEIVIPQGDPRRRFPASSFLIGAGARITGPVASRVEESQGSRPSVAPPVTAPIPHATQTPAPELPPHPALNNPNAIVIPRGDPSRQFPAADFLFGAR